MIPLVKRAGRRRKKAVTSTVSDTERPLRADARRNRERILASARAAFAEGGPAAHTAAVRRHAGVGVGIVYRQSPATQGLMTAPVRETSRLIASLQRVARPPGEKEEGVRDQLGQQR